MFELVFKPEDGFEKGGRIRAAPRPTDHFRTQAGHPAPFELPMPLAKELGPSQGGEITFTLPEKHQGGIGRMLLHKEGGPCGPDKADGAEAAMDHLADALPRFGGMAETDDGTAVLVREPGQLPEEFLHLIGPVDIHLAHIRGNGINHHEAGVLGAGFRFLGAGGAPG